MVKASILVVDDEIHLADTLADVLNAKGYNVSVANDGFTAVALTRKTSFDIVLMDIKMPGMNGVEAYKQIKKAKPETRAIMMTGYSVEHLVKEATREGAYVVMNKPIDIGRLLEVIRLLTSEASNTVAEGDPAICETTKDALDFLPTD